MFIFGKASQAEIKEMTEMGWDVEEVDVEHFDKSLQPDIDVNSPTYNADRYDDEGDKLVAIFVDYDIVQECRDIKSKELA